MLLVNDVVMSLRGDVKLRHYVDYTMTLLKLTGHLGKKYDLKFVSLDYFVYYHIFLFVKVIQTQHIFL